MLKSTLDHYKYIVDGTPYTLRFRYPSVKESRAIKDDFESADESRWAQAANRILVGWEGEEAPTYSGDVADILTIGDLGILTRRLLHEMTLGEIEKKGRLHAMRIGADTSSVSAQKSDAQPPKNP